MITTSADAQSASSRPGFKPRRRFQAADTRIEGYALPVSETAHRFVVISTQGKGDEAALRAILGGIPKAVFEIRVININS